MSHQTDKSQCSFCPKSDREILNLLRLGLALAYRVWYPQTQGRGSAVRWGLLLSPAIVASNPSAFWGLHPGPVESEVQGLLELPVVWMEDHQPLRSVCLSMELEVVPMWLIGRTEEARTWGSGELEHFLVASPATPVLSNVSEVNLSSSWGWGLLGSWARKLLWRFIPQALISLAACWTHSVWRDCRVTGRCSPGPARWLAPLASSPPEPELTSVLGQGLTQPPLLPLALELESELEVDQPLLIPLTSLSELTERDVHTRPFFQFLSWLFALSEKRVPQLDKVPTELSEEFPPLEDPDLQLAVEERLESVLAGVGWWKGWPGG